jgi:hypothetical protein
LLLGIHTLTKIQMGLDIYVSGENIVEMLEIPRSTTLIRHVMKGWKRVDIQLIHTSIRQILDKSWDDIFGNDEFSKENWKEYDNIQKETGHAIMILGWLLANTDDGTKIRVSF